MEQLLYGSAEGVIGQNAGGWGVIRASDDLQQATRERLTKLASVFLPQTMPRFPNAEQLANRSLRFRLRPHEDSWDVCMSVEAGPDHTGRPGNVTSHCAEVPQSATQRGADWFTSQGWVLPHGPNQVAEASLPVELPEPRGWAATAEWLRFEPSRIQLARFVVADGIETLQRKQPLIVVASSPAEGARWVSAILWMLPPAAAAQYALYFGEDAQSMGELRPKGAYIAVLGPDVVVPSGLSGGVVDATKPVEKESLWGQLIADLLVQPDEVGTEVFTRRDALLERYESEGKGESFTLAQALQVAWYTRPNAQHFGQEQLIADLLEQVGPMIRTWPELQWLEQMGLPNGFESRATAEDAYGLGDDEPGADNAYRLDSQEDLDEMTVEVRRPRPSPLAPTPRAELPLMWQPAQSQIVVDRALEAAARLGTLEPLRGDWLADLETATPEHRADLLAVAAAASFVVPEPKALIEAARRYQDLDRAALEALARRSQAVHGTSQPLQRILEGQPWQ